MLLLGVMLGVLVLVIVMSGTIAVWQWNGGCRLLMLLAGGVHGLPGAGPVVLCTLSHK